MKILELVNKNKTYNFLNLSLTDRFEIAVKYLVSNISEIENNKDDLLQFLEDEYRISVNPFFTNWGSNIQIILESFKIKEPLLDECIEILDHLDKTNSALFFKIDEHLYHILFKKLNLLQLINEETTERSRAGFINRIKILEKDFKHALDDKGF